MDSNLYVPILVGTTREGRQSYYAAKLIYEIGRSIEGIEVELIDPRNFTFPGDGNDPGGKDPRYTEITKRADSFFIVTPEYNHSFPGSLKRMLDSELENYNHKVVAFAGASSGSWGGVRAIEALVSTTREMGLVSISIDINFPKVQTLFDDQGILIDSSYYPNAIKKVYEELIWMSKALKNART
jgi:NAD(P)H-dependent FMN reductase